MWTTDIVGACAEAYRHSADPPDFLFCTAEQADAIRESNWWHRIGHHLTVSTVSPLTIGRHSRPLLVHDPDQKGKVRP